MTIKEFMGVVVILANQMPVRYAVNLRTLYGDKDGHLLQIFRDQNKVEKEDRLRMELTQQGFELLRVSFVRGCEEWIIPATEEK